MLAPALRWLLDHHRDAIAFVLASSYLKPFETSECRSYSTTRSLSRLTSNTIDWLFFDAFLENTGQPATGSDLLLAAAPASVPEDLRNLLEAAGATPMSLYFCQETPSTGRGWNHALVDLLNPDTPERLIRRPEFGSRFPMPTTMWGGRLLFTGRKDLWGPTAAHHSFDRRQSSWLGCWAERQRESLANTPNRRGVIAMRVAELWNRTQIGSVGPYDMLLDEVLARLEAEASAAKVPRPTRQRIAAARRRPKLPAAVRSALAEVLPRPDANELQTFVLPDLGPAIEWLLEHHGPAVIDALDEDFLVGATSDQRQWIKYNLPAEVNEHVRANAVEWIVADAMIEVAGVYQPASDLLLASPNLDLDPETRSYIKALREYPLCIYRQNSDWDPFLMNIHELGDRAARCQVVEFAREESLGQTPLVALRQLPDRDNCGLTSAQFPLLDNHDPQLDRKLVSRAESLRSAPMGDEVFTMEILQIWVATLAEFATGPRAITRRPGDRAPESWFEALFPTNGLPRAGFLFPSETAAALERLQAEGASAPTLGAAFEAAYHEASQRFANTPLPLLRGLTPRKAVASEREQDHARVAQVLLLAERHELALATDAGRPPLLLDMLWQQVALDRETTLARLDGGNEHPATGLDVPWTGTI